LKDLYWLKTGIHLELYYTLSEFKSIGQENSLKKFNKKNNILILTQQLLKIYKNTKIILVKFGNKYYNAPIRCFRVNPVSKGGMYFTLFFVFIYTNLSNLSGKPSFNIERY